ncbi:preprotein translocase subunit SecA [Litoribacillus peritrichatus]|uniref:Protein translocase subunit SecA n=1 Tax=Litoribacillus peritrichatus TaxID=718191 RepID=A0ABP7M0N8_9GAMM
MFAPLVRKLFGSKNDREIKRLKKIVANINEMEADYVALSDEQLVAKTAEFKKRVEEGESLDAVLPEAFAVVREAGKRVMGMRHFDVQLIGGMTLHGGNIAEMRTGEGKTLVATLPVYLNALSGKGVHVVTVNDYLAKRDSEWMGRLYRFLGLSVGVVYSGQDQEEKKAAYQADITYGTNNEFGFDYLRDNMAFRKEEQVMRGLNFVVVDEVDSILIDEARTPLVISGPVADNAELYTNINKLIPKLQLHEEAIEGHYTYDEKQKSLELTEDGHTYVEELLVEAGLLEEGASLYAPQNLNLLHHIYAGLKAHVMFHKNVEYIVQNKQVVIIDEHTGRTMPGRRWGEGIHQAIEAKEGIQIQAESQTLASTTFQNFFRLYDTLSGMTGTADTEAFEFQQIYGLDVIVIPANKTPERKDFNDLVYLTKEEKYAAIIDEVRDCVAAGRPLLVGTASIETSEYLSGLLKKDKIAHSVLNAKHHAQEAEIISQAGIPGAVTIATNMAGRGTDIVLGGNWEVEVAKLKDPTEEQVNQIRTEWQKRHDAVLNSGGLHVVGSERHESRRIDNQLRGRAGRQGDAGSTRFFLSLEDDLMRIFASDRVKNFMQALGMQKGEAIEHRMVSNAIEKAQRKVEGRNFDIRKQLLEYDDVANDQRTVIYQQRQELMAGEDIQETIQAVRDDVLTDTVSTFIPPQSLHEQWDVPGLEEHLKTEFAIELPIQQWLDEDQRLYEETLREKISQEIAAVYQAKEEIAGAETLRNFEKQVMLQVLDSMWKDHLATMDHLRQGIHLRGYAQKNPKQEYKREAFELFQQLLTDIKQEVVRILCHVQVQKPEEVEEMERQRLAQQEQTPVEYRHDSVDPVSGEGAEPESGEARGDAEQPYVRDGEKVGRNDPCPCGSGKKYKQCHGKI